MPETGPVRDQLQAEAAGRGLDLDGLVALIRTRAEAYTAGILALGNITRASVTAIGAAEDAATIVAAREAALGAYAALGASLGA